MLERTQNVDYRIPSSPRISSACRDFLSHLLVADPDQRLSTAAIMEHPWFGQGLPSGVKSLNDECLRLKVAPPSLPIRCPVRAPWAVLHCLGRSLGRSGASRGWRA